MKHTWNHRVIRKQVPSFPIGTTETAHEIHEVHYEDGVPILVTNDAVLPYGETVEDLIGTLNLMLAATNKPVIDIEYFNNLSKDEDTETPNMDIEITDADLGGC